ncbi:MAG: DUF3987 domain-containing protein [Phycisphaeraceae bacterium]|nr:DUF3987 domain-containing protein [Phycisphaeraceae bacterium]
MTTDPRQQSAIGWAREAEKTSTPIVPDLPRSRPFPLDALPRVLRDFAADEAAGMGCDPVLVVLPALAALASAVGNSVRVVVRHKWAEPCGLFVGVVALPSNMKSPAQRAALAPVWKAQRASDLRHTEAMNEYTRQLAEWDGRDKAERGEQPVKPARVQCVVQNTTTEALAGVLGCSPRGVLVAHDELAVLFGGLGRYGKSGTGAADADAAFYRSAFHAETFIQNRKSDGGTYLRLDAPLLSVCGGIQPGALERVLRGQRTEDGTASRFLWAMPPDNPGGWVDEAESDPAIGERYAEAFAALLRIPFEIKPDGEPDPAYVGLSGDAKGVAREWVNNLRERTRAESDPAMRAALGKLKGVVFRLALLFHLTDWAARGGEGGFGAIGPRTMRDAARVADWFAHEAERVYGMFAESDADRERRAIVDWIRGRGGSTTLRDLTTSGPRRFRSKPDEATAALKTLEDAGLGRWVHPAPGEQGGRPSARFVLTTGSDGSGSETPAHGVAAGGFDSASTASTSESVAADDDGWGEV